MTVIRDHASLSDAWEATHPTPSPSFATLAPLPSPSEAIEMYGVTTDSPSNTFSAGKHLDLHAQISQGKRLDYILFRDPAPPLAPAAPLPTLVAADARVLLTGPIPGLPFSYSDHFGVSATLQINYPSHDGTEPAIPDFELRTAHKQAPPIISALSAPAPVQMAARLAATDASAVSRALSTCLEFSRTRAKRHLLVFGCSAGALISFMTTAHWFPYRAVPFVILGGAVATWLGTTMLYVGFIYGRWEANALMNVIEELELYRKSVEIVATTSELDASIKP
jgi:sphingomyelin phosphodiesterase 2